MPRYAYERLSAIDTSFLTFEGPTTHMHVGGVGVYDAGPLAKPEGGVDIDRIRAYIASRLHLVPRYRQRLAFVPIVNRPVWVDDDHFNLNYHVRHANLPHPGDERQLKRLCGRIMSQQLDREKPLWEAWIIEGLQGGRFVLLSKAHHCMVDGIAGVDLIAALMSPNPDEQIEKPPHWEPRPAPTPMQLLREELAARARAPAQLARTLRRALDEPERVREEIGERASAVWQMMEAGLLPPAPTPLNRPIGPHRRFDWLALELGEVKAVKNRLGGTVNDVVLAIIAGAMRRFLQRRKVSLNGLEYRVTIPVNTRAPEQQGQMGNRVSAWLAVLPIQERDPRQRLERVREMTGTLKKSHQARGAETLIQLAEWVPPLTVALGVRLTSWLHPYNLIISNVPGPQLPLYMLGAPMRKGYPLLPLFENQGLAVAILSYAGKLCFGINADWDLVPDLHAFVEDISASFRELQGPVDGVERKPAAPARAGRRPRRAEPRRASHGA
jgi:diacylglycerol O-acyltransferase / wax synthase